MESQGYQRNTDGLIRWQPGQSGNPAGRPKGITIMTLMERELSKPVAEGDERTKREAVAQKIVEKMLAGDPVFTPLGLAYLYGKPKQSIELNIPDLIRSFAVRNGWDPDEFLQQAEAAGALIEGSAA